MKVNNLTCRFYYENNKTTTCVISSTDGDNADIELARASTVLSNSDKFNRRKGAAIAFKRAVSTIGDRGIRTNLWLGLKTQCHRVFEKAKVR